MRVHAASLQGHRQRATDRAQLAGQSELTRELVLVESMARNLFGCNQYADRDRQVEAAGLLRQIRGRKIDGDTSRSRKAELRVLQRRANALAAFLDLDLRKSDEIECRQTVGEMHFDANERRVHAGQRAGEDDSDGRSPMVHYSPPHSRVRFADCQT